MFQRILIFLLLFLAVLWIVGQFLSGAWSVERSIVIAGEREAVYDQLADLHHWPEWISWESPSESPLEWEFAGAPRGVGAVMRWSAEELGQGSLSLTEADPATGVAYAMGVEEMPKVLGRLALGDDPEGIRVTWSSEGDVGSSVLYRYMVVLGLLDASIAASFDHGLEALKLRIEEGEPEPETGAPASGEPEMAAPPADPAPADPAGSGE